MQQTSAVRSSIASANRSGGIEPSGSGRTCTTSAPRSSCAWAIWPTVGNSYSLITIRFRSPSSGSAPRRARSRPARPTSSPRPRPGAAWSRRANALRNASCARPSIPLGAVRVPAVEPLLDALPHAVRERPLRARVEVRRASRRSGTRPGSPRRREPPLVLVMVPARSTAKVGLSQALVLEQIGRACPRARSRPVERT